MKACPHCSVELEAKNIGPVEIDECQSCKGIWFDKDELRQAKDATDSDLNWMDFEIWRHEDSFTTQASPRMCPTCVEPMVALQYGATHVTIDYCKSCKGTWLDRHEFKKILYALEEELSTKSLGSYVKDSIREGLEVFAGPESLMSEWKDFSNVLRFMQYRLFVQNPALLDTITTVHRTVR